MLEDELQGLMQTIDTCCSNGSTGLVGGVGSEHEHVHTHNITWTIVL